MYYRKIKNWTQLDLAEASSLSEDYIGKIENGKASGLTINSVLKIAEALDCKLDDLIKEEI